MNVGRTVSWFVSIRFPNRRAVHIERDKVYLTELQDESAERMKEWLIPGRWDVSLFSVKVRGDLTLNSMDPASMTPTV